jgi:hypothetical protein
MPLFISHRENLESGAYVGMGERRFFKVLKNDGLKNSTGGGKAYRLQLVALSPEEESVLQVMET